MTVQISACLIVRDEAANLDACLRSIRPYVDELIIVDTGSTDGSVEIAKKYADLLETFLDCNDPETGLIEDFALARNRALEMASGEWMFWCDGDDVVTGGENLRKLANSATGDNVIYLFPYEYGHDAAGRVVDLHYRERLFRPREKFRWRSPVHEVCMLGPAEGTQQFEQNDSVRIVHQHSIKPREIGVCPCGGVVQALAGEPLCRKCGLRSGELTESRGRNLRILKKYVAQVGEADVRALYYLGNECLINDQPNHALRYLRRYVELSQFSDEKGMALLALAKHYFLRGDYAVAIDWCHELMRVKSWPAVYWWLARSYYHLAEDCLQYGDKPGAEDGFRKCVHFGELGLYIDHDNSPKTILHNDPRARYEIQECLNVAYSRLGMVDKAVAACELGLTGMPDSPTMAKHLAVHRGEIDKRTMEAGADALVARGQLDADTARAIKGAIRGNVEVKLLETQADGTVAAPGAAMAAPIKRPDKLDLVFFTGPALERWNGATFEKSGMGGSETMCWELARRLAKLGHAVRIYGDVTPSMEGLFDGVQFLNHTRFKGVECDVLICSRRADPVEDRYACRYGASVLWLHDLTPHDMNMTQYQRIDRWLALTNWHREFLLKRVPLQCDPRRIHVTRNGVDLSRFEGTERRNPHRAIYSSSPDRGLQTALDVWPEVRKEVPDAELHIFYGFFNWEESCRLTSDNKTLKAIQYLKGRIASTEGVFMHDRVPQKQLAREFMKSGVWASPTWFSETFCITAAEAQLAGCRIVTSALAALNETVGKNGTLIEGPFETDPTYWQSDAFKLAFREAVMRAMTDPEADGEREAQAAQARERFSLDTLADDWDRMLLELHASVVENVLPAFFEPEVAA